MELSQRLARNLKSLRGDTKQGAFARKAGISRPTLNRLESGSQNISLKTLETICKSLKCDMSDLFEETTQKVSKQNTDK
ncbi:helix-turn-helix domain-containing protein [Porticoccus sp. GXU_MW_L64]